MAFAQVNLAAALCVLNKLSFPIFLRRVLSIDDTKREIKRERERLPGTALVIQKKFSSLLSLSISLSFSSCSLFFSIFSLYLPCLLSLSLSLSHFSTQMHKNLEQETLKRNNDHTQKKRTKNSSDGKKQSNANALMKSQLPRISCPPLAFQRNFQRKCLFPASRRRSSFDSWKSTLVEIEKRQTFRVN